MTPEKRLIKASDARQMYLGGISQMTEYRWRKRGILPEPIRINKRCFYREADLLAVQNGESFQVEGGAA